MVTVVAPVYWLMVEYPAQFLRLSHITSGIDETSVYPGTEIDCWVKTKETFL